MSTETAFPMPSSVFDEGSFLENQDLFSLLQSPGPGPSPDPACSNSGSGGAGWAPTVVDERKRRRMMSNRESARRSRMRKQRHLEDLRNQVHRLRIEKRELASRLALWSGQCHLVRRENVRLLEETVRLRRRFSELRQGLIMRQLQEIISSNEQIPHLVA